jgi:hypothetical protein
MSDLDHLYPTLGKELPTREANCTRCGQTKHPKRGYLALLKSRDLPYVCQACRDAQDAPPMNLGKLGAL